MPRRSFAAFLPPVACALFLAGCAGNGAPLPPQSAAVSCRDQVDNNAKDDFRATIDDDISEDLSTMRGPLDFYSLYPDCP